MNFLIIGDVVGRSGRNALQNNLKKILLEVMASQEKFMKISLVGALMLLL